MLRRWITPRALLAVVSVGLILAGLARMFEIRGPNRPRGSWQEIADLPNRDDLNVVFVVIDTLRADRLSAYGYERETSPIFDALAESGVLFRDVQAQSTWTKTSMASLWTGVYPSRTGIVRYPHALPESATSPVEILRAAGFRTVGIWRNGWVSPNFGFHQGFDLYYKPVIRSRNEALRQNNPSAFQIGGTDQDLTSAAAELLRNVQDERFLLYVHYMDVHQYVYDESADFGTTYSDIYDNSIRWVDANLGTLVAILQQEELMERTLLVVASDHGEAFREHDLEGHGKNLYRETTGVPLLLVLPFRLEQGIEVTTPVENIDVWPTLLDLLGLPPLPDAEGRSLVPLIEAAARGEEDGRGGRPRFAHLDQTWGRDDEPQPLVSVEEGGYRYFWHPDREDREGQLYHVEVDPYEQQNIVDRHPEVVDRLRGRVRSYVELPPAWGGPDEVYVDDAMLGQLRALGYVDVPGEKDKEGAGSAGGDGDPGVE